MTKQTVLDKLDELRAAVEQMPDDCDVSRASIETSSISPTPCVHVSLTSGVRALAVAHGASVDIHSTGQLVSTAVGGVEFSQFERPCWRPA